MMAGDGEPMVDAVGVTKRYGETAALRGVTFTLPAGSAWAVTGPSGSGKSTLLYLIGALDRPTSGTLRVAGTALETLTPEERAAFRYRTVGFVFQEFHLLEDLPVEENVLLPFVGRPRDRRAHRDRALWLLDQVGLADHRHRPAGVLSGGEKQRVAIARALVNDPPLLLCDEPTGNLDQATGAQVMDLLQTLASQPPRKTLVVVTHDAAIAGRFPALLRLRDGLLEDDPAHGKGAPRPDSQSDL